MLRKPLPKKKARQAKIVNELQVFPQMKVQELSDRLDVSQETIRRDLADLARQGQISRTFGGAVGLSHTVPGIDERKNLMIKERDQMSQIALKMIAPNDLLMIGGGSTTMRLAIAMSAVTFPVTVVTHSLPFATIVSKNKFVSVELLPGSLNPDEGLTVGSNTLRAISKFTAHKAFVGASGVNEHGLYALLEPGEVYGAMIAAAKHTYMFIDSTKFEATSLAKYGEWTPKISLITDRLPNDRIKRALDRASVDIFLPGENLNQVGVLLPSGK